MAAMIAALVRDAARKIERDYFCRHFADRRIVFLSDEAMTGTALLAVDRDDLVVGASRAARVRLGLNDTQLSTPHTLAQLMGEDATPSFGEADRAAECHGEQESGRQAPRCRAAKQCGPDTQRDHRQQVIGSG